MNKRKLLAVALVGLLALSVAVVAPMVVHGQNPFGTNLPSILASGDIAFARGFSFWQNGSGVMVTQGNGATGSSTLTVAQCQVTAGGGLLISPFSTTASITVLDGSTQTETVTPTAVSPVSVGNGCNITANFTYVHGTGATVQSGTYGLQEAINYVHNSQTGGMVIVSSNFPGSLSTITGATGYVDTMIQWNHSGYPIFFVWNGSNYVSNPSANLATVNLVNPTALTALMSQTQAAGQQNYVGRTVTVNGTGFATAGTGGTATVRLYLLVGADPVCDLTSAALPSAAANYPWTFAATLITAATGTSGALESHCTMNVPSALSGTTATAAYYSDSNVTTSTLDLTAANTIALQGMFSASVATSRLAQRVLQVEYKATP